MSSRIVYVGNLPLDIKHRELEDLFYKYGRIRNVDLKLPPRPPGFAFVEFDDPRDAMDAVRGRDGYEFFGNRLRVSILISVVAMFEATLVHSGGQHPDFCSSDRQAFMFGSFRQLPLSHRSKEGL